MLKAIAASRKATGRSPEMRVKGTSVTVLLPDGRSQVVICQRDNEKYTLESMILPSRIVQRLTIREVLVRAWQRNRSADLVSFDVDDRLRLVGRIQRLADTLDPEELEFYVDTLARECDEFEYLLTGKDEQ